MRKLLIGLTGAATAAALAGCGTTVEQRAASGALGGAAIGGVLTDSVGGAVAGAAVGGVAGAATAPKRRR